jgi:hypothetical protein
MDFTQFVSMLENKGLFFTRADLLEDKFEGTMSRPTLEFVKQLSVDPEEFAKQCKFTKGWTFVNCWHINDNESAAMWKIYSTSKESICVQTIYGKLRDALAADVYIGSINYISYDHDKIPPGNAFWPLMHKRRSFEYERELRAVWSKIHMIADAGPAVASGYEYQAAPEEAIWKLVDLGTMAETVFVSPTAKPWFLELLRNILDRYDVKVPIRQSNLAAEPIS